MLHPPPHVHQFSTLAFVASLPRSDRPRADRLPLAANRSIRNTSSNSSNNMSNAEQFLQAAHMGLPFPADALPDHRTYEHPLVERYATKEMSFIWSPAMKFTTWRKLWTALATAEQELGLDISDAQLAEMRDHIYDIDFALAAQKEREFRHDVMGHVHAFGAVAPTARPVIHLGATSCYVGDNTDLIQMRDAMQLIQRKLVKTCPPWALPITNRRNLPRWANARPCGCRICY
jgi:hypothetical protein